MCVCHSTGFSVSQVYGILLKCTPAVQPVSCDEAFLDVTGRGDPEALAAELRAAIFDSTGCTASAGISHNILLAKLATTSAKPNGQFRLPADQVHISHFKNRSQQEQAQCNM